MNGLLAALTVAVLMLSSTAFAQSSEAKQTYERAQAALKKSDCKTAVAELTRFKTEAADYLKAQPEVAKQVDDQIRACESILARPDGITGQKIRGVIK